MRSVHEPVHLRAHMHAPVACTCCSQLWGEERVAELAKLAGRGVLGGICKMIFPTLLKQACAGCSAFPVVEVWDGNVKDTVRVDGANVKWLQGQMLAMARGRGDVWQWPSQGGGWVR